jgi:Na+/H+-dicarboxylate symporter
MFALRNSKLAYMNPWMLFGLSIGTLIGTVMCDYEKDWALKNIFYGAFVGTISLTLIPLIHIY